MGTCQGRTRHCGINQKKQTTWSSSPKASQRRWILQAHWFHEYEQSSNERNILEQTGKRAYTLVKGQCSPVLMTKLEGTSGYNSTESDQDVCKLLKLIRGISCQFNINTQGTHALTQAKWNVYVFLQKDMTNNPYLKSSKEGSRRWRPMEALLAKNWDY